MPGKELDQAQSGFLMMLMCRQVAKALANHNYWELPLYRRISLRVHVALCLVCGRYHKHVVLMQEAARAFLDHEDELVEKSGIKLSEDSRRRIKELMRSDS